MSIKIKSIMVCLLLLSTILFSSCSDKVDKMLDKYDDVVSKYEDKAKSKTLTDQDITDMATQISTLGQDMLANGGGGLDPTQWSDKQRARYMQLQARGEKLSMAIMNGN